VHEPLIHRDHAFINFANGSFQRVDIQRFGLTGSLEPGDPVLLAAMIAHDVFGNDYATRPGDDPARHGPYWRDRIAPTSYTSRERREFVRRVTFRSRVPGLLGTSEGGSAIPVCGSRM